MWCNICRANMDEVMKLLSKDRLDQMEAMTEREYAKNKQLIKSEDVRSMLDWVDKQPHLPKIPDIFVIFFLHRARYSSEKAKQKLENFFTTKSLCPEVFANRDPTSDVNQRAIDVSLVAVLPKLTPEGNRIVYLKLMDYDVINYNFAEQIKLMDMVVWSFIAHEEGTNAGYVGIADFEGVSFEHLAKTELTVVKKYAFYLQKAAPVHIRNVHIINPFPFVDKLFMVLKQFFSSKKLNLVHVHKNIETLYEFVPKDCLPRERGGSAGSFAELHEIQKKLLVASTDLLILDERLKVDESKRAGAPKTTSDQFGTDGTFKKLEVD